MPVVAQIFFDRELTVQALGLKDNADAAPKGGGLLLYVLAEYADGAAAGDEQSGQDAERGRFPAAVRSQQAEDLSLVYLKADVA